MTTKGRVPPISVEGPAASQDSRAGQSLASGGWPTVATFGLFLSCAVALAYSPDPLRAATAIRLLLAQPLLWLLAVGVVVPPSLDIRRWMTLVARLVASGSGASTGDGDQQASRGSGA